MIQQKYPVSSWQKLDNLAALSLLLQKNLPTLSNDVKKLCLDAFRQCYQQPNLTWNDIALLLRNHPHPFDQQAIWSLPLRHILVQQLKHNKTHLNATYRSFSRAMHVFLFQPKLAQAILLEQYSAIFISNLGFFQQAKAYAHSQALKTEEFAHYRKQVMSQYWRKTGYQRYLDHLQGSMHVFNQAALPGITLDELFASTITDDHMNTLCDALKIDIKVKQESPMVVTHPLNKGKLILEYDAQNQLLILAQAESSDFEHYQSKITHLKAILSSTASKPADIKKAVQATSRLIQDNPLKIDQAIAQRDTNQLIIAMRTSLFFKNYIGAELIDKGQLDYFARLQQYALHPDTPRVSFDNPKQQLGLPVLDDVHVKLWIGSYNRNVLPLEQNLISGQTILHSSIVNADRTLFSIACDQLAVYKPMKSYRQHTGFRNLDIPDLNGMTPLHYLCRTGRLDWIGQLHRANRFSSSNQYMSYLDFTLQDKDGNNALHHAIYSGSLRTVEALIKYTHQQRGDIAQKSARCLVKNQAGLTPVGLAYDTNQLDIVECLVKNELVHKSDKSYLAKVLPTWIQQSANKSLDIAMAYNPELAFTTTEHGNLIHWTVSSLNYQAMHIILHPISPEQRAKLILQENNAGQTPFALLETRNAQDNPIAQKFARIMALYDPKAKAWTQMASLQLAFHINQDFIHQLKTTWSYQTASKMYLYAGPLYEGAKTFLATGGNLWLTGEAIAFNALNGDVLDKAERLTAMFAEDASTVGQLASGANTLLSNYGLVKYTTRRLTKAVSGGLTSLVLNSDLAKNLFKWMSGPENTPIQHSYLKYLEASSLVFFGAESILGGRLLGPYLEQYWQGVESTFCAHFELPTAAQAVNHGLEKLNEHIYEKSGVDVKRSILKGYRHLRQTIGGVKDDALDQSLFFQSMSPDELNEYLRMHPDSNAQIVYYFSPEQLTRLALDLATGAEHKDTATCEILASILVDYYDHFMPLSSIEREQTYQVYFNFLVQQQAGLSWAKDSKKYIEHLRDALNDQIREIEVKASTRLMQDYFASGKEQAAWIEDCLKLSFAPQDKLHDLQPLLAYVLSQSGHNPTLLQNHIYQFLTTVCSPVQDTDTSVEFLRAFGEYAMAHHVNIGIAIAQPLTVILNQSGHIPLAQQASTYEFLVLEINNHYWNDQTHNKADFNKSFKILLESVMNATQFKDKQLQYSPQRQGKSSAQQIYDHAISLNLEDLNIACVQALNQLYPDWTITEEMAAVIMQALSQCNGPASYINCLQTFLLLNQTPAFMQAYLKGQPLNYEAKSFNLQYTPREVRAAFAVNWLRAELNQSNGYIPLTAAELYLLFTNLCEITNNQAFEQAIFESICEHCPNPGQMTDIHHVAPAEFAKQIESASYLYGENHWQGSHEMDWRPMNTHDPDKGLRRELNRIKDMLLGQGIQINANTHGQAMLNMFNLAGIGLDTHSAHVGFIPPPKFVTKPSTATELSFKKPKSVVFKDSTSEPTIVHVSQPPENKENVNTDHKLQAETSQDSVIVKGCSLSEINPNQAGEVANGDQAFLALLRPGPVTDPITDILQRMANDPLNQGTSMDDHIAHVLKTMDPNSVNSSDPDKSAQPNWAMPMFGLSAAIMQAPDPRIKLIGLTFSLSLGLAIKTLFKPEENLGIDYSFPIHKDDGLLMYPGAILNELDYIPQGLPYPDLTETLVSKTETQAQQEGFTTTPFIFPINPQSIIYWYNTINENKVGKPHPDDPNVKSTSGEFYDHNLRYDKHKPTKQGFAMWGKNYSMNPIPDIKTGQYLLDTAYQPANKKWKVNYQDGNIIKFMPSGDGFWHAFEVDSRISKQLEDTNYLKYLLNNNTISKAEYNKLIRK